MSTDVQRDVTPFSIVSYFVYPNDTFNIVQLIDSLNKAAFVRDDVNKVALWFTYLALVALVGQFLEVAMFMWSGVCSPVTAFAVYAATNM